MFLMAARGLTAHEQSMLPVLRNARERGMTPEQVAPLVAMEPGVVRALMGLHASEWDRLDREAAWGLILRQNASGRVTSMQLGARA
jgi:hypothetical protein